jgi:uncharacterized protein (DUF1697 family)
MKLNASVALLRGINVGGHNKVSMKDLAAMFAEARCEDVQTYIQSGNVVFRAGPKLCAKVAAAVSSLIEQRLGLQVPVIVRTLEQMTAVAANNPFLLAGAPIDHLHVMFLADAPAQERIDLLDPQRSPPGEFLVRGQEIYLSLPAGAGQTKLTNQYFDSKLATIGTGRNWRTVTKLLELMQA